MEELLEGLEEIKTREGTVTQRGTLMRALVDKYKEELRLTSKEVQDLKFGIREWQVQEAAEIQMKKKERKGFFGELAFKSPEDAEWEDFLKPITYDSPTEDKMRRLYEMVKEADALQVDRNTLANVLSKSISKLFHFMRQGDLVYVYEGDEVGTYKRAEEFIHSLVVSVWHKGGIQGYKECLHTVHGMAVEPITSERHLVCADNGIVDLHKRKLLPFSHEYFFKAKMKARYIKDSIHPIFPDGYNVWEHLRLITGEDYVLLREAMLYAFTPNISRRKYVVLTGRGKDFKSYVIRLIGEIVGDENSFLASLKTMDDNSYVWSNLEGKTAWLSDDNAVDYSSKAGDKLKMLANNSSFEVRQIKEKSFQLQNPVSMIFAINGHLHFTDTTEATYERQLYIPMRDGWKNGNYNATTINGWKCSDIVLKYVTSPNLRDHIFSTLIDEIGYFESFSTTPTSEEENTRARMTTNSALHFVYKVMPRFYEKGLKEIPTQFLYDLYRDHCKASGRQKIKGKITFLRDVETSCQTSRVEKRKSQFSSEDLSRFCEIRNDVRGYVRNSDDTIHLAEKFRIVDFEENYKSWLEKGSIQLLVEPEDVSKLLDTKP